MTYKKFMSLFLLAGSIVSTLCSCAATDSSAVVGYPCIIKVTRKEDATVIPLAEVRNRITDYLLNSRISTETELIQNRLVFTETDAFQNTSIE